MVYQVNDLNRCVDVSHARACEEPDKQVLDWKLESLWLIKRGIFRFQILDYIIFQFCVGYETPRS